MMLTDLADAARKSGLTVVELSGWRTNGRPASTGSFAPRGVLCHHTGSYDALTDAADDLSYAKWLAFTGRPSEGLPAPLCHLALSAEGVVYVTAAGRANHAGAAKASGPLPGGDGNELYIGIEAMNSGTQGWSATQYDAYVRLCRALVDHYGWTAQHVRAHKETSITGKWDPGLLDMDQLRADVGATTQEDDMPTAKEFVDELLARPVAVKKGVMMPLQQLWRETRNQALYGNENTKRVLVAVDAGVRAQLESAAELATLIRATPGASVEMQALADDIATKVRAALNDLELTITVQED